MFDRDGEGRETRRFGGVEFVPSSILVRGHGEKKQRPAAVLSSQAHYDDPVALVYGTGWIDAPVVMGRNDGNLTRMEVLLGMGPIEDVLKVVVGDVEIPEGTTGADLTGTGWYRLLSRGDRNGVFNPDFGDESGNPLGDPYGSMAYLSVVVPNQVNDGRTAPRVQVLVKGLRIERFGEDGTTLGLTHTNNPAWVLLDLLRRSGWTLEELDLGSFARAASHCGELVAMTDLNGNPTSAPRYQCNLIADQRRSVVEYLRGVRLSGNLILRYEADGKLAVLAEGSLADQQATKPSGSNAMAPLNGGWPAYEFCDGSAGFSGIAAGEDSRSSLRLWSQSAGELPNRYTVEFQDEFNEYQSDSLSLLDAEDAKAMGQETATQFAGLGIANFDQAYRLLRLQLNRTIQGNRYAEFETSVRGIGLRPGDLITLTVAKQGLARQLFRVLRAAPGRNFERVEITARWHEDTWYLGSGMEGDGRRREGPLGNKLPRPLAGSVTGGWAETEFGVEEKGPEGPDEGRVRVACSFHAPKQGAVNALAIPFLDLVPLVESSGGELPGGQAFYYAISAVSGGGSESPLSYTVRARTGADGSNYRVVLRRLSFGAGVTHFRIYRGASPQQLLFLEERPVANTYVDTGAIAPSPEGPPDANFDHANFYWRLELQPPLGVEFATATTAGGAFWNLTPGEYRGTTVRIVSGMGAGQEREVLDNTSNSLTVAPSWSVIPNSSSTIAICEGSWQFGALGKQSPVVFSVPNRPGATIHISGRAANSKNEECAYATSPLTRWTITGTSGARYDADNPPAPIFGLQPTGDGTVTLTGPAFATFTNTRTITAGTLSLWFDDELQPPLAGMLQEGISETEPLLSVAPAIGAQPGSLLLVDQELLMVVERLSNGSLFRVERGSHGSAPATHAEQSSVTALERVVSIVPFPADFFGSPASGSFRFRVRQPNVRIRAAELFVTNSRGSSPVTRVNYTQTAAGGLRTLNGGQYSMQVDGVLGIEDNVAPPLIVEAAHSILDIVAHMKTAPFGGAVQLRIRSDEDTLGMLTIASGMTVSNALSGAALAPLNAGSRLALDIVSVPQGPNTFPGADLTVTIRL
jgi:hypothetical protein